ncbi:MAG: DUF5112 domain-containing protein [Prevotellaceae bacterium]|nr:DUF5112 domain-containing protein [Prevotellaceae bacterium]
MKNKTLILLFAVTLSLFCLSCSHGSEERSMRLRVDSLNRRAYDFRYSNIDSVRALSHEALRLSGGFNEYALLNLAYAAYQQMDYAGVDSLLEEVRDGSNNQIYLLCADVLQMKTAQRICSGTSFYRSKRQAEQRMARIEEERGDLSPVEEQLFVYASSEYYIILSTYYFYQQSDSLAIEAIEQVHAMNLSQKDLVQWIYYNYMIGSGGLTADNDPKRRTLSEFDHLVATYSFSRRLGYIYFEANALQSLSYMFERQRELIEQNRPDDCKMLEAQNMSWGEGDLPMAMMEHALYLFQSYGDLFQTACVYRSEGELFFGRGQFDKSIERYTLALHQVNEHHRKYYGSTDTLKVFDPQMPGSSTEARWLRNPDVLTVPEWIAGIRQRLSLSLSAVGDKPASDYNRNAYLDILLNTNQNDELQDLGQELASQLSSIELRLFLTLVVLALLIIAAFVWRYALKRKTAKILRELSDFETGNVAVEDRGEIYRLLQDMRLKLTRFHNHLATTKTVNVESRAKVSLVHSLFPYVERISVEVRKMEREGTINDFSKQYIQELVDEIERLNGVLTEWIQIRPGDLLLRVKQVSLRSLFEIVEKGHYAFDQKGVRLCVEHTEEKVKADEALTLFMINTLADNARKFTPSGGTVTLKTLAKDDYVEIQVSDTGRGLSPEEVERINSANLYTPMNEESPAKGGAVDPLASEEKGYGFGLLNCRNIIEKYHKHSGIFRCCLFGVRSQKGKGSTFFFRLPRFIPATVLLLMLSLSTFASVPQEASDSAYNQQQGLPEAATADNQAQTLADRHTAHFDVSSLTCTPEELYDSVYQCNIEGRYTDAWQFGGKALALIDSRLVLFDNLSEVQPAEITAYQQGLPLDYHLIMGLRNELALTALALNDWALYTYNNDIYTQLQKFANQDDTLPKYCEELENARNTGRLLLVFIILLTLFVLWVLYRVVVSPQHERMLEARLKLVDNRLTEGKLNLDRLDHTYNEINKSVYEDNRLYVQNQIIDNCLSTLKHESMYYPSRIRQLAAGMSVEDIGQLSELVSYYHYLCSILCRQADEQLAQPAFKRQYVALDGLLAEFESEFHHAMQKEKQSVELYVETEKVQIACDPVLLSYCLMSIARWMMGKAHSICLSLRITERFVEISLHCPEVSLSDEQLADLFSPAPDRISLLVAKQIVREHDIYNGNPGLRLYAIREDQGYAIKFTMVKKTN